MVLPIPSLSRELTILFIKFLRNPLLTLSFVILTGIPSYGQFRIYQNGQGTLRGSDTGVHLDTPTRQKIDLAGIWIYSLDNENWKEVKVPSAFDYEGRVTFLRKFSVSEVMLSSSAFKFVALGINHDAEIYINDVFIGKHVGGYTTIEYDIPENVMQLGSENALKVVVSNQLSARSTLPLRKQIWGWKNYGGILRDIYLLVTPRIWIDGLVVRSSLDSDLQRGTIQVAATLSSGQKQTGLGEMTESILTERPYSFVLELYDKFSNALISHSVPQQITVQPNRDVELQASLLVDAPKLWSPDSPELYTLKASLFSTDGKQRVDLDEFDRNVGFCRVTLKGHEIIVNGKPLILRGIVWHEDSQDYGGALTYEQMERDIALIKTIGVNAVRFAFHPPHPYMLNLCSRYGLFALEELPVWNVPGDILNQDSFQVLAEAVLQEMINRDRHHPSVLAWGIGDEFDSADSRSRNYVRKLAAVAKELDSRPVYYGTRMLERDLCSPLVDLAGLTLPPGDAKSTKQLLAEWKNRNPEKPVLVLRYGKDVEPDNRNGYSDPMSQEAQARYFIQQFTAIKESNIAGSFANAFADWRGDRPILTVNTGKPFVHPVGLLSLARERREAFDVLKALYNNEKITALPIGRYRATLPVVHVVAGFVIIFVVAYMYHYNRRFNDTFRRSLLRPYNFYADLRDLHAVSIPQSILVALSASLTVAVVLSSLFYHYRQDRLFDYVLTQFLVSDALKVQLISAAWNPVEGIFYFWLVLLAWYPLTALLIKLFSILVKTRVQWYHAFSVAIWGSLPLLLLSPLGMSLFKLLENPVYVIPSLVIIGAFGVWIFVRVLKGISIIYDVSLLKAYGGGVLVVLVACGSAFVYYESAYSITSYVEFILNIARSQG